MTSGTARLVPIRRDPPTSFGTIEPPEDRLTVDAEAIELTNASIVSAALALGIYIDTFV